MEPAWIFCTAKFFSLETFFDLSEFFSGNPRGGFGKSRDDRRSGLHADGSLI